jgi:hypothetical protein
MKMVEGLVAASRNQISPVDIIFLPEDIFFDEDRDSFAVKSKNLRNLPDARS